MSKYEHTPALALALRRASAHARSAGRRQIEPADLLHGLLAEEEGLATVRLLQAGLDLARLRPLIGVDQPLPPPDDEPLACDDRTRAALAHGRELAVALAEENTITSEQALLGVLEESSDVRQQLERLGLDFALLAGANAAEPAPLALDIALFSYEPEPIDVARILDATANRAREALRVLEDYARFSLDDALLSRELKELRHGLAEALADLPADLLLHGRDTLNDVGTGISTEQEQVRSSIDAVVRANAKRLQEALRSLEEFGKVYSDDLGPRIERLRYRSYTVERALLLGAAARARLAEAQLYVLAGDAQCRASLRGTVKEALLGGAQMIQLREKTTDDRTLLERAREVRRLTRTAGALFIVNDRPDIALLSDADGVHLGQDDMPIRESRRIVGPDALIGVSTHNLEQVRRAVLEGASYLGVGPTFPSRTKDFSALAGLDFVRQASVETSLPMFALGGITLDNVAEVLAAGAGRVAVSHAICAADDPQAQARRFRAALAGR